MKYFAVVGNPILFSLSPEVFNSFFKQKNIEAKYIRMAAESAREAIDFFKELGLSGMNITSPFKSDIIQYLDFVDEMALEIGSVNTVVEKNGALYGYNTDYYGIVDTLKNLKDKKVLLLGAGGAAKAVVYSVLKKEAQISIYNRTKEKAINLARKYSVEVCSQEGLKKAVQQSDIIVNTLPSGVKVIEDQWLKPGQIFFEATYHNSVYENIAEQLELQLYPGKDWLINQAIPAFKLFFEEEDFQFKLPNLNKKTAKEKIILTGFMGSGKSSIGSHISKALGYGLFCTDTMISDNEQSSINNIFEANGEASFRQKEHDVLKLISSVEGRAIVSSGGGLVLNEKNRKLISEHFISVCLYANSNAIMARVNSENRPLLKNNFTLEYVRDLIEKRMPFYLETADIIINTSNKQSEEVLEILNKELLANVKA